MEEQWQTDRARLRKLCREHPTWSQRKLAEETKRSISWVKKWRKRLDEADPGDPEVLKGRSRRPHQAGSPIEAPVIDRILMEIWQVDFKDVTTVRRPQETDKQQHFVETLNMVDSGTSILVDNPARFAFNAEPTLRAVAAVLQKVGCPRQITFDRDTRFMASAGTGDFPSPFVRFLACLGIKPDICPPQRPDRNGYVERYNKTYKYETILIYRPET